MTVFSYAAKAAKVYRRFTRTQYLIAIIFILAMAGIFSVGFFMGKNSAAATLRDCSENSIDNSDFGDGCGALSPSEMIADLNNNDPGDLQTIFADSRIGLDPSKYDEFAEHAKMGHLTRDGKMIVDGETVMTDVWTMGRTDLGGKQPTTIEMGGKTYFHSAPEASFGDGIDSLPAMVLFDEHGTVKTAVLAPCGNPVTKAKKVKSSASCDKLHKTPVEGKKDTYAFTTDITLTGLAQLVAVEYYVDEGDGPVLFATEPKADTPVERHFTKDATVIAKVLVKFPGGKEKLIESEACVKHIKVEKKEVPPEKPKPPKKEVKEVKIVKKVEEKPLPVTGPAGVAAIFAGTSAAGAIGHHLYAAYRNRNRR